MNDSKELRSIMEAFYNAAPYGNPESDNSSEERVTYSKTQKKVVPVLQHQQMLIAWKSYIKFLKWQALM